MVQLWSINSYRSVLKAFLGTTRVASCRDFPESSRYNSVSTIMPTIFERVTLAWRCLKSNFSHSVHPIRPGAILRSRGRDGLLCNRSGSHCCLEGLHKIQNHVHDRLIADRGIDHG